uniref:Serpentine receptor class gamma n=1 Tax=Steinernema glaseri TaxID=37863 RepID=A0A1I7YXU6_9BILA
MRMPTPLDICFLAISAFLFIMYIFFLITLVVYRWSQPFRSVFFSLTLALGVVDVLQMFHTYLLLKFPSFGWMTNSLYLNLPQSVVKYGSCALWALAFNQHIAVFIIAVNRFSAIVVPHGHNSRWSPFATRVANFLICFSGVFFVLPKIVYNSSIKYEIVDNVTMSATIVWGNQQLLEKYKYVSICLNLIVNMGCFVMYMTILCVAVRRHHGTLRAKVSINRKNTANPPDAMVIYHQI